MRSKRSSLSSITGTRTLKRTFCLTETMNATTPARLLANELLEAANDFSGKKQVLWIHESSNVGLWGQELIEAAEQTLCRHFVVETLWASCDRLRRPDPAFPALIQLLDLFFSQFVEDEKKEAKRQGQWKQELIYQLSSSLCLADLKLLQDLIPDLEEIVRLPRNDELENSISPDLDRRSADETTSMETLATVAETADDGPETPLGELLTTVFRLIQRSAPEDSVLLFIVQELHWMNETTLDWLVTFVQDESTFDCSCKTIFLFTNRQEHYQRILCPRRLFIARSQFHRYKVQVRTVTLPALTVEDVRTLLLDPRVTPYSLASREQQEAMIQHCWKQSNSGNSYFWANLYLEAMTEYRNASHLQCYGDCWTNIDVRRDLRSAVEDLPMFPRETLSFLACFGSVSRVPVDLLVRVLGNDEGRVHDDLEYLADETPFVIEDRHGRYALANRGVMEYLLYEYLETTDLCKGYYTIGVELWRRFDMQDLDHYIFVVIQQLYNGKDMVRNVLEKDAIARLCLRAGEKSVGLECYTTAFSCLSCALDMLGEECWIRDYPLCLDLYSSAAEVAYSAACHDDVEPLVQAVLKHAKNMQDAMRVLTTKTYTLGTVGRPIEALEHGIAVLRELGIVVPNKPSSAGQKWIKLLKTRVGGLSNEYILRLPNMSSHNHRVRSILLLLNAMSPYAFLAQPHMLAWIAYYSTTLTLDHGLSPISSRAFVACGVALIGYVPPKLLDTNHSDCNSISHSLALSTTAQMVMLTTGIVLES